MSTPVRVGEPQQCTPYLPEGIPEANEEKCAEFESFDALMLSFMKEHKIPGLSLAISRKGKFIYTQCYGHASHGELLRPRHVFRIASVSKVLTAVGVMRLHEDGCLKLSDKAFGPKGLLSEFSPAVSGDRRVLKITVKHLLQHSAGWDREIAGDPVFWRHVGEEMGVPEPVSNQVLLDYMMRQKLQFTPGTKYVYSNLGYIVLGRIIERVAGTTYETVLREILHGISITEIRLGKTFRKDAHGNEVEYFASPKYRSVDSIFPGVGQVAAPYGAYSMEAGDADGGWIASPRDLVRLFHCLEGVGPQRLLKQETFKLMLDRPSYARGSCWYGLGLDVSWYRKAWEHGGHVDGATSSVTRSREGFTWAILCNYWPMDSDYTSLISYGLAGISSLNKIKRVNVKYADAATRDKMHLINIKVHQSEFENLRTIFFGDGYRISWFDGYQVNSQTFFNVVWSRDKTESSFVYNLSSENLKQMIDYKIESGHRPIHIDPYLDQYSDIEENTRFAVIFHDDKEGPPWILQHDLPLDELNTKLQVLKEEGYSIKCLAPYYIKNQGYVSLLAVKDGSSTCWPKHDLLVSEYDGEFKKQTCYGHLPSYIKSYVEGSDIKLSVVWTQPGPFLFTAEHDMSPYRVLNDIAAVSHKKFIPSCVCGYEEESGHRFAVVCVKEVSRKRNNSLPGKNCETASS